MRVVATAGHVDHGKSTLVRALTGVEPDRLAEEQRRGLTIDLGFAWTRLAGLGELAFVDVPGHVDFIRTMIAGVAVVDAALLVVDAREGWRAQTHQHVHVLRTVGVDHLVVAVTKADLVDPDRLHEVTTETAELLAAADLPGAAVVACDAVSGRGLDELRAVLAAVLGDVPSRGDRGRPRLWIDRAFTIRGTGTVVTGGLTDGTLQVGDQVCVVGADEAIEARVRGIEALGDAREQALPGGRTALNLARVGHRSIRRGDALVRAGDWHLTDVIDVELDVAPALGHPVSRRGAFTIHLGSSALAATLRLIGATEVAPGERGAARVRLPRRVPLVPGDRYVLVETGRGEIVGGGQVLDVDPVLPVRRARPDRSVDRVVAERGWVDADELHRLTGVAATPTIGRWVIDSNALETQRRLLLDHVTNSGPTGVALDSFDDLFRAIVERLRDDGALQIRGGMVQSFDADDDLADHPFLERLRAAPFQPPTPADCGVQQPTIMELRRRGLVTSLGGLHFATSAIDEAERRFAALAAEHPDGVTVAMFRDSLGTTRKWAMPILTHLDAIGVSRRCGDVRRRGPRLASRRSTVPS